MKAQQRPRRDLQWMKARRLRAGRMFANGKTQAEVARALGVSRQSVSRWHAAYQKDGPSALRGAERAGRKPRLTEPQLRKIDAALRLGPEAEGFSTNLWTLPRVAKVIERVTGVRYHPGHVWRVLRGLGWSLQRPAKRARERDEDAVRQWLNKRWPEIKKKPDGAKPGFSSRTRAASRKDPRSVGPGRPEGKPRS